MKGQKEMRDESRATMRERGFSLIELLVAMVITMLIMGSVYGLIAGGQNAFRREPELAERQQNIRMAMDLIMKDISNAASGLPTFVQAFRPALDALGPQGPDTDLTDEIEILTNSESRDTEPVCRTMSAPGGTGATTQLMRDVSVLSGGTNPLLVGTIVVPFTANGQWTLRSVVSAAPTAAALFDCTAGAHTAVDLMTADPPISLNMGTGAGLTPCTPNLFGNTTNPCELVGLSFANLVRYRIRMDTSVPPVPMLERWSSDATGAIVGGAPVGFQTLARGIENLQVQYLRADGDPDDPLDWSDAAPLVVPGDYRTLITQVRVTLAARSEALNIAGGTTSVTGGDRIRGTLMSSASPRATLMEISLAPTASPAPPLLWR
jgi:prepilin-type N-terminal cleavage/methylation domain-containing protein